MKHKSVDARRYRRSRFKRAVQPMMRLFNCTMMQVADHIAALFDKKAKLEAEVERLKEMNKQLRDFADKQLEEKNAEIRLLSEKLLAVTSERDKFESELSVSPKTT